MGAGALKLDVVTWKWRPLPGYRSKFTAEHVNLLAAMVRRWYAGPHRFSCITDDAAGIDHDYVRVIPLWPDHADLCNPSFRGGPNCYRRLKAFSREAADIIGPRFVSLDLDCVVTGDLAPLWERPDDFVIWGDTAFRKGYNGSMWLLRAGTRSQVWDTFDPGRSPKEAHAAGQRGSDQGWITHCLGPHQPTWKQADGVYSYRNDIAPRGGALPENARIVFFHGHVDPDNPKAQGLPWVREHYRK
jgi:hypothetical protein